MTRANEVEPVPPGATPQLTSKLNEARRVAVDALLEAEDLEAQARKARRQAAARLHHYSNLLREHGGQLKLEPFQEESA